MAGEIIVGLDIGTTKICAVAGELQPDGIEKVLSLTSKELSIP